MFSIEKYYYYFICPISVTSIGESAFSSCSGSESVTIGEGMETIGSHSFYSNSELETTIIGGAVESIEDHALHMFFIKKYHNSWFSQIDWLCILITS